MKRKNDSADSGRPSRNTKNNYGSTSGKKEYRRREEAPGNRRTGAAPAERRFNGDAGERPGSRKKSFSEEKPFRRTFTSAKPDREEKGESRKRFEGRERKESFQRRKDTDSSKTKGYNEKSSRPFGRRDENASAKGYTRNSRQEEDTKPRRNVRSFDKEEKPASRFKKRDTDKPTGSVYRKPDRSYTSRKEETGDDSNNSRKSFTRSGFDKKPGRKTDRPFDGAKPRTREEKSGSVRSQSGSRREKPAFDADRKNRRPGNFSTEERPQRIPFQKNHKSHNTASRSTEGKAVPEYDLKKYESRKKNKGDDKDQLIRLNRYIANAGVCSRRDADSLIEAGEIKVNGKVITEMGYQVNPNDIVKYGNRVLNKEKLVYLLLNKPKDFITTTDDPDERKTVMDLVKNACEQRIYPVGRLDRNTTGLLLLTNDGEVAEKLAHPSNDIKKIYQVELDKPITEADFEKIMAGVELEDGKATVDEMAVVSPDATILGLEIHIGKNRIVRRIFEHLGYEVIKLDRVSYAGLTKKDLPRGHWRFLTEKEVIKLKYFI